MSSPALYEGIRSAGAAALRSGDIALDPVLAEGGPDRRRGLSLVIHPRGLGEAYEPLATGFAALEPEQYYYPAGDLHVTVFDFCSAREGYARDLESELAFLALALEAAAGSGPFPIAFRGVACSREAGLLAGYDGDRLVALRAAIRSRMLDRGLPNDERYESRSAHASFLRFRAPLRDGPRFLAELEARREEELGEALVEELELVEHDWFDSGGSRRLVGKVAL
ncbi:MAG TPA: hypothetical protein PLB91_13210 [Spirochaetales bacterium]|nr:hypothetical protein [Spirochaetales bacterium]HRY54910.1 hypothetical protein [Spirochaetia bacterium]HRZ63497.1 hypothetical protein [Spirochaetia bacterium]